VDNRVLRAILALGGLFGAVLLVYVAVTRPGYFTSNTSIAGLLLLELLAVAVWLYRRMFFAIVITAFLLAGVDLPVGGIWTMGRWGVLGLGAMVGLIIVFKERRFSFGIFEILAFLAILAAVMSAAVSRFTSFSFLKVLSLVLLFLYSATGARVAVLGRESRFFTGLLAGCQLFVAIIGGFYLLGIEAMGNPNSLGAVMGVVAAPILLWGTLLEQSTFARRTQLMSFALAMYLTYISHARASIAAVLLACGLLCLCLRRYMLLGQGVLILAILIAGAAIFRPEAFSNSVAVFRADVVYKGKSPSEGLLSSRTSPWQETINTIRDHYWFGTGFGTSDTGQDPTEKLGKFASSSLTSKEHGSSYLEILEWVGVLGSLPFLLLLGVLLVKIFGSMVWMFRTANPSHPIVPLAIVLLAGLVHAAFEDWLFAPGYYLCVFFWSIAFVFTQEADLLAASSANPVKWTRAGSMVDSHSVAFSR
jgi:O-antigen ligase